MKKKMIFVVGMMVMMVMTLGFTNLSELVVPEGETNNYNKEDINWDMVSEICTTEGISIDFGISKEACSEDFLNKISSGNFSEDEVYEYFCNNFEEYPNLVVNELGTEILLVNN